jgi:3-hydroxybutyrate dehydrogenase
VIYSGADMTKPDQIRQMVKAAQEGSLGRHLVNNAGIQHTAPIEASLRNAGTRSGDQPRRCSMPSGSVAGMKARNRGRIVNIASIHGLVASVEKSAYVAAKARVVIGLTKAIATNHRRPA